MKFYKQAKAARLIGVSLSTFRRMVANGEFPPPVRRNRRWVRVPASDVEDFLRREAEQRQQQTTPS